MGQKPLRIGIISANWGATAHLPAWRSFDGVEVKAICTSRPETARAAAEKYGIERAYHDFNEMAAAEDIDLIDCGTRPPLRYQMVKAALDNGKHVYNGIPFAASLSDARDMVERLKRAGTVGAVDAICQANPAMIRMKELIDEGFLGKVYGLRATVDHSLFTKARVNVPEYMWFGDAANGCSPLRNMGSHVLHPLVHTFGKVQSVVGNETLRLDTWEAEGKEPFKPEVPDTIFAILKFESGLVGQFSCSWSMVDSEGTRIEVWGDKGRLVATAPFLPQASDTRLFASEDGPFGQRVQRELEIPDRLKSIPGSTFHADKPELGFFPMASVFRSIIDEIEGRGKAAPSFEQALHVHEIVESVGISSRESRWVDLASL